MMYEDATQEETKAYIQDCLDGLLECRMPQLTDEQIEGLMQLRAEAQELIQRRRGELGIDKSFMGHGLNFGHMGGMGVHNQES
jgi:hypothetical protein